MRKPKPRESAILSQCIQYLRLRGWKTWRNNSGGTKIEGRFIRFGEKGSSDAFSILPGGRLLCCETKRPGEKARPEQEAWLEDARRCGALALVVTSLDELRRQLAEAGYPE